LQGLRFETFLEIIRNQFDNNLKIIEFFEQCNKPNIIHFFLAEMINKGHAVITTNFDFLIEHALIQSNNGKNHIYSVITEKDYKEFKNIFEYLNTGKKYLFKIHGSMKDILAERDTREYFLSLIKKIGSYKSEFDLFFIEPYKGVLLNKLLNNAILILLGYSGQNDFDIIPILKDLAKTGLDCIAPLDPLGGFTPGQVREIVGDRVSLMGGVNTLSFINNTSKQIIEEAKMCILEAGKRGGYILSSGCVIPRGASKENLQALKIAVEKYGVYQNGILKEN